MVGVGGSVARGERAARIRALRPGEYLDFESESTVERASIRGSAYCVARVDADGRRYRCRRVGVTTTRVTRIA